MSDRSIEILRARFGANAKRVQHNLIPVVVSYLDAATVLGVPLAEVETKMPAAAELFSGCPACRHGRAGAASVEFARQYGALSLHVRDCQLDIPADDCRNFEPICPPWKRPPFPPEVDHD